MYAWKFLNLFLKIMTIKICFPFVCFDLFTASKTVLNSMIKDPSSIPDQILSKNIYQVSI